MPPKRKVREEEIESDSGDDNDLLEDDDDNEADAYGAAMGMPWAAAAAASGSGSGSKGGKAAAGGWADDFDAGGAGWEDSDEEDDDGQDGDQGGDDDDDDESLGSGGSDAPGAFKGNEMSDSDDDEDEDENSDIFEDHVNPESRDQRFSESSDSEESEYEEPRTSSRNKGKGRATVRGSEHTPRGRGRPRGSGVGKSSARFIDDGEPRKRGRPKKAQNLGDLAGEEELEDLRDDDELDGDEFEGIVNEMQRNPQTHYDTSNIQETNTASIAADLDSIRDELALAAGFKRRRKGRSGVGARREKQYPPAVSEQIALGNSAFATGDNASAKQHMREVLRLDATVDEAWLTLSSIFREEGRLNSEFAALFMAAHLKKDAEFWRELAERSGEQQRWQQAVYCMKRAVTIAPDDDGLAMSQAVILKNLGLLEKSLEVFKRLLKRNPYDLLILRETETLFLPLNRVREGIEFFERALRWHIETFSDPEDSSSSTTISNTLSYDFVHSLCDLLILDNQWDRLILVAKQAQRWMQHRKEEDWRDYEGDDVEFDPPGSARGQTGSSELWTGGFPLEEGLRWRLAVARFKLGHEEDAEIHAKVILEQEEVDDMVRNLGGWTNIAHVLMQRQLFQRASDMYELLWEKLQHLPIFDPEWIRLEGMCFYYMNNFADAIVCFKTVLDHYESSGISPGLEIKMQLARCYEGANEHEKALEIVNEVRAAKRGAAFATDLSLAPTTMDTGPSLYGTRDMPEPPRARPAVSRKERELLEAELAADNLARLQEVQDAAFAGDQDAAFAYKQTASAMITKFRQAKGLYPIDKTRKFYKPGEGPKRKTGYEADPDVDPEQPAPAANEDEIKLQAIQRTSFSGLHADVWIEIVVRYCCLRMLDGQEREAIVILDHVGASNIFNPAKYFLPLHLTMLGAAIRLGDDDQVADLCRAVLHRFQFRRGPIELFQAAVSTGRTGYTAMTNLNLQKFVFRELRLWDAAAEGKTVLWNDRMIRYIWRKSQADKDQAANKKAKRAARAAEKDRVTAQAKPPTLGRRAPGRGANTKAPSARSSNGDDDEDEDGDEDPMEEDPSEDESELGEDGGAAMDDGAAEAGPSGATPALDSGAEDTQGVDDGNNPRYMRRRAFAKPTRMNPHYYLLYGQLLAGSFQSAIYYFLKAYEFNPHDPLVCLHLALAYLGRSMNRQSDNRLHQISTGMAFLNRYRRLMQEQYEDENQLDEVEFNMGRAFHGLGMFHLAVKHYQLVLARVADRMTKSDEAENVLAQSCARDAAFSLHLIFQMTGAQALAKRVTEEWLTL